MKIENINIDGRFDSAVNVSEIVGFGGRNREDDVMLIQGLFRYIAKGLSPGAVGLGEVYKIPEITGVIDAETSSAIGEFQIRNAKSLLTQHFDSRIHPASYKNRRIGGGGKRYMAITFLHLLATDTAVMSGDNNYIQALANLDSKLARHIDMTVINS